MPELPEVETIRCGLEQVLPGRVFAAVEIGYGGSIKDPAAADVMTRLPGKRVTGTGRRGKYLQIFLDDDSVLVIHLRMTGQLVFNEGAAVTDKHTHVVFSFTDGSTLAFSDIRKFGTIWWVPISRLDHIKGLATLGPEPLSGDFHFSYLNREVEKRTVTIKALLLNQQFLAGLGNIYADEILHRAQILPQRKARSLSRQERQHLFSAIRDVLAEAIECRGTSMSDYRDSAGALGEFQNRLQVYGRRDQDCPRCQKKISRSKVAGRGTHYCTSCQH
ncbi:bifunctional DNA-formamidopyrimidine glycosylase/DNA-(apurinic or apyrimidinic site) lyase [Dethiobacter alkaliphilus]|uniref:bifunctional DNA-formamidopyrimidine glycosylase/DNA-(apurinic or apyrimidinic site) lyase n=1 Tax=Dethiobacter alkaliphilus TaxID=427926 RepID=UPI002225C272|nr:bifunctional DNA-formamidopyrimidine glycosylase/DNA-(apurinic or apyrimidinic site) lyase [Dethiobacter alkaliphilus]MCW3490883.1 bifunctional DNA-formamidopyrimidine glycosylase/DNA-(apurinic or apyrimidinic site) lyase [Dethiobacter alkaliphilus]